MWPAETLPEQDHQYTDTPYAEDSKSHPKSSKSVTPHNATDGHKSTGRGQLACGKAGMSIHLMTVDMNVHYFNNKAPQKTVSDVGCSRLSGAFPSIQKICGPVKE